MKNKLILLVIIVLFLANANALAQDAVFTQWENMPLYTNPALTGNFEGLLRGRAIHRNQWHSILKNNSYRTSAVSAEYKFSKEKLRKISVGIFGIKDKAGSLALINQSINFSTSVVQHLGNPDHSFHSIAVGLNVGLGTRKIDLLYAQWPGGMPPSDVNEKTSFPDVSAGLLWQYRSNTHFSFQLGSALHHVNRPNVSFIDTSVSRLNHRFNLHGHVEIPIIQKFSIVPSFLFSSQEPSEQFLFGFNNRWYPKAFNSNFVQLGLFAKTNKNYNGTDIPTYVASASVEINSFLVGFSFDRYQEIESNAYEFSVGYRFGGDANNIEN